MILLSMLLLLAQDPQLAPPFGRPDAPPVGDEVKPTPAPDTSRLPRADFSGALGRVSERLAIEGQGALPDRALVELVCPGNSVRSLRTEDRFDLPIASGPRQPI